ncbi:MAG: hypothetical protein AAGF74_16980 [Pseudomonadota bacterium]
MQMSDYAMPLFFGSLLAFAPTAEAQNRNCGKRAAIVERLSEGYGESRQMIGLGANNSVIEMFASEDSGTWTITVTLPNGMTCLVASGQSYEEVEEDLTPAGADL